MTRILMSAVTVALLSLGTSAAGERPKFTGTWQSDMATLVITDTPNRFTVERRAGADTEKLSFTFVEQAEAVVRANANPLPRTDASPDDVGGATRVLQATVAWHDDHLDAFVMRQINGKTVTQNMTYTIDPDGSHM